MTAELDNIAEAKSLLNKCLSPVPFVSAGSADASAPPLGLHLVPQPHFLLPIDIGGNHWILLCAVKSQVQPRQARMAVLQLKDCIAALSNHNTYPVLIAPYISPESAEICRQAGVGYADFAGNCFLSFEHVFIERSGVANPKTEKRRLRSIFSPKSARILRVLLRNPTKMWRVVELAEITGTSVGQVSNMRKALVDREWAAIGTEGLTVTQPGALLDAWRDSYDGISRRRTRYYSLRQGTDFQRLVKEKLDGAGKSGHVLLGSFSAAQWAAPFARYSTQIFYADTEGESILRTQLGLESATKGENVVVEHPIDDGVFIDRIEAAPGIWSTGLIQTYLDLAIAGERGAEAAGHLRTTRIEPMWKATS